MKWPSNYPPSSTRQFSLCFSPPAPLLSPPSLLYARPFSPLLSPLLSCCPLRTLSPLPPRPSAFSPRNLPPKLLGRNSREALNSAPGLSSGLRVSPGFLKKDNRKSLLRLRRGKRLATATTLLHVPSKRLAFPREDPASLATQI